MARVTGIGGFFFRAREPGLVPGPRRARLLRHVSRWSRTADAYPNGRFAELGDPEGNRIQLWEPNAASVARDPGGR